MIIKDYEDAVGCIRSVSDIMLRVNDDWDEKARLELMSVLGAYLEFLACDMDLVIKNALFERRYTSIPVMNENGICEKEKPLI